MTERLPTVYPTLRYRDAQGAIRWLTEVVGFSQHSVMSAPDGTVSHAELAWGDGGMVMLGTRTDTPSPYDTGQACIYLVLDEVDAHHDRAVAAGAEIVMGLTDQPYGSREYAVRDPEGNVWCFGTYQPATTQPAAAT
jgi:uncharacterized glyoxalase superfamily protein PhnB